MLSTLHILTLLACGSPGLTEMAEPDDTNTDTADTSSDTAVVDDTADTNPGDGSAPEVSVFKVTEEEGRLRFAFQVKDTDDDLDGGSVEIKVPPRNEVYVWPSPEMSISNNTVSIYWDAATVTPDTDLVALLSVTDAAGNKSQVVEDIVRHDTEVYYINESGDKKSDAHGLGMVTLPVTIHGDIYAASNNGSDHTGDSDWVKFAVPTDGNVTVTLTWDNGGSDYDVYLFTENDVMLGWSDTFSQPETFGLNLQAGTNFFLKVGGWDGAPSDWTLTMERTSGA
jgi:hypothetical protein